MVDIQKKENDSLNKFLVKPKNYNRIRAATGWEATYKEPTQSTLEPHKNKEESLLVGKSGLVKPKEESKKIDYRHWSKSTFRSWEFSGSQEVRYL
eukprot:UN33353